MAICTKLIKYHQEDDIENKDIPKGDFSKYLEGNNNKNDDRGTQNQDNNNHNSWNLHHPYYYQEFQAKKKSKQKIKP